MAPRHQVSDTPPRQVHRGAKPLVRVHVDAAAGELVITVVVRSWHAAWVGAPTSGLGHTTRARAGARAIRRGCVCTCPAQACRGFTRHRCSACELAVSTREGRMEAAAGAEPTAAPGPPHTSGGHDARTAAPNVASGGMTSGGDGAPPSPVRANLSGAGASGTTPAGGVDDGDSTSSDERRTGRVASAATIKEGGGGSPSGGSHGGSREAVADTATAKPQKKRKRRRRRGVLTLQAKRSGVRRKPRKKKEPNDVAPKRAAKRKTAASAAATWMKAAPDGHRRVMLPVRG